jgi:hypothetical protein
MFDGIGLGCGRASGLKPGDSWPFGGRPLPFTVAGVGVAAETGFGVCVWDDAGGGLVADFAAGSWLFLFRREDCSFSAFSMIALAILSNSEQTPNMRCTPPVSASCPSVERKVTTRFMSRVSDRALGSRGFWRMFPKSVTSAETGK